MTYEIKGTQIYCLNELTLRFQSVNQSTKVEVYTTVSDLGIAIQTVKTNSKEQ